MEELNNVSHFKEFRVNSYETDKNMNLKINCLFQWFSEIAWEHAKKHNLGFEDLGETEHYWVLLGMNVKINKLPRWQDLVKLQTWPSGISNLYFSREFIVYDNDNNILITASSSWLIYNRASSRPAIPKGNNFQYKINAQKATDEEFTKLKPNKNLSDKLEITARYTDIDMHQHVNNAVYIKWIENYLGELYPEKINGIKIQYIREIKLNEEILLFFAKEENVFYCEAIAKNDNKTCFRAEIFM
jgi:acyl-ACP thioesterase